MVTETTAIQQTDDVSQQDSSLLTGMLGFTYRLWVGVLVHTDAGKVKN